MGEELQKYYEELGWRFEELETPFGSLTLVRPPQVFGGGKSMELPDKETQERLNTFMEKAIEHAMISGLVFKTCPLGHEVQIMLDRCPCGAVVQLNPMVN